MALETERLILDEWRVGDWETFRPIATDAEVMRYITGGVPWSDEQVRRFVERQVEMQAERGYCRWRLAKKEDEATIGFCGLGQWREERDPEIGWWLARREWGKGLATEAARAALRDAFERAGVRRVISVARVENAASIRVMEKLGLRREREFELEGLRLVRYGGERA